MPDLSLVQRLTYGFLGYLFQFTHWTSTHRFLGAHVSAWLKFGMLLLLLAAWIGRWGQTAVLLILAAILIVYFLYWIAKRAGYFRFVPSQTNAMAEQDLTPLPHYQRVPVSATGVFSVETWERHVLFGPADYWQAPRGGHGLMVAHQPGRYLYQFFDAQSLLAVQQGWILYGRHPRPALAISFRSIWGPELVKESFSFFGRATEEPAPIERTVYLSFADKAHEQAVWQNIVLDARRVRLAQPF